MRHCEFCTAALPDHTPFCGYCGRAPRHSTEAPIGVGQRPAANLEVWDEKAFTQNIPSTNAGANEEEEKRRRAAAVSLLLSLLGDSTVPGGNVPMVQGTPQIGGVPFVQGTPQTQPAPPGWHPPMQAPLQTNLPPAPVQSLSSPAATSGLPHSAPASGLLQVTHTAGLPPAPAQPISSPALTSGLLQFIHKAGLPPTPAQPISSPALTSGLLQVTHTAELPPAPAPAADLLPSAPPSVPSQQPAPLLQPPQKPQLSARGCLRVALVVFVACALIAVGFIGAGLTIFSPGLSLSGSTHVTWGQSILVHGNNFIPGSNVVFTLDSTVSLDYASTSAGVATSVQPNNQIMTSNNSITVSRNGTFNVTFNVSPNWHAGDHTIRATEQISRRSAVLNFTIESSAEPAAATPTLAPTDTPVPTVTPSTTTTPSTATTPSTTVTPSPTSTVLGLSCVTPSSITLAANPNSNQASSKTITLCTGGSGLLNWTASWNQKQAPWLRLDHSSGQIQAPAQGQVTVSAQASGLKSGNYTTTVTFSSQPGNATISLNVTFTVHSWCVSVTSGTLSFTGVVDNNNPSEQTVTVKNCSDAAGNWSASSNANWLTFDPTDDTLSGGGDREDVTISVSLTGLKLGTYNGSVTFKIGSSHATLHVTLTLKAPSLSVTPTSLSPGTSNCKSTQGHWVCQVTVRNNGDVQGNLNWSATSSGRLPGITFTPSSGTLGPGSTTPVEVDIPSSPCPSSAILTFTGPLKNANVTWSNSVCSTPGT